MPALLWLKDDLRIEDHAACAVADRLGVAAVVYIDRPAGLVRPTARRRAFETATLDALAPRIRAAGIPCRRVAGLPADHLPALCATYGADRVVAYQESGDAPGFASDRAVAGQLVAAGIAWIEVPREGIARGNADAPLPHLDNGSLRGAGAPRRATARQALTAWLDRLPAAHYRRDMWRPGPDRTACSRLSLHLACGALSSERALHDTEARLASETRPWAQAAYRQFRDRLHWRAGFIQAYERHHARFPDAPMREARGDDAARLRLWQAGDTGVPVIDAAMRDLNETGWINFRLRQTVASFALEHLDLDPFAVGVALGELFDDYVPGIHWPQIMLQAGLLVDRGPRVVNPVKQGRDLDPDETWVRSRIPALAAVPHGFAHAPWLYDPVRWRPLVDPVASARAARRRYAPAVTADQAQPSLF